MRTQEELIARIKEARERDVFGFEIPEYLVHLTWENLQAYFKDAIHDDATKEAWEKGTTKFSLGHVDAEAKSYLTFFKEKMLGQRGVSVIRAVMYYMAWKWLLGHEDADTFPGAIKGGNGGTYQRLAYEYLEKQITSGEWDKLTKYELSVPSDSSQQSGS